jgi:peptidoglycan-associated lipoprotein
MISFLRHGIPLVLLAILAGCSSEPSKEPSGAQSNQPNQQPAIQQTPRASASASLQEVRQKTMPSDRSVYYDLDKSEIKPGARSVIQAHAQYLRDHPGVKIRIEGNADERGSAEYNLALGQRRAEGVTQMMKLLGVPEGRVEAVSLGKEKPRKSGHDEASWAENRRSDIVY